MPYADLRAFLSALERMGRLQRITAEVDKDWELVAVARHYFQTVPEDRRKALFFERVRGYDIPVVLGVLGGSRAIYAAANECPLEDVAERWRAAQERPLPPRVVADGPVHEVVYEGDRADVTMLPVPVWTVGQDPGPYLTAPFVITRDPETGVQNVGTYRIWCKEPRKLLMNISFSHDGRRHVEANNTAGRPTPVVIVLGADPSIGLASVAKIRYGVDELAVAGAVRGEPVEVVRARTVDLLVPATAEITIEGWIRPNETEEEGPFGEYTGYIGRKTQGYVIDVTALTHRHKPIFQAFLSQMPPSESSLIRGAGKEVALLKHLKSDLHMPVKDVHLLECAGSAAILVISIHKDYWARPQEVMWGAWAYDPTLGKYTVVVDDDIDIRDPQAVLWAMAYRVQPDRDVHVIRNTRAVELDPSVAPYGRSKAEWLATPASKLAIDATRKHEFPPVALPPAEHLEAVRRRWATYFPNGA